MLQRFTRFWEGEAAHDRINTDDSDESLHASAQNKK
jgi:hypothetical protein